MPRFFRFVGLLILSAYLSGCGSETPAPPTGDENKAAQQTAAQMPPPPGAGTKKAK